MSLSLLYDTIHSLYQMTSSRMYNCKLLRGMDVEEGDLF